jgi:hypothetical protein
MAKKQVNKVSDKLTKVNESFTVSMYDNGYMLEISGKDSDDNWKTAKLMVQTVDQLMALVKEATELPRDE